MSESKYSIVVEIDPAKSRSGSAEVAKSLEGIGTSASRSKSSVDNLLKSTQGLATAIRSEMLSNTAKAFEGLTQQMQREANVLEKIRGPMRDYENELKAVEMLHRRGLITAKEYEAQLGKTQSSKPGTGTGAGGAMASIGGGAQTAAGALGAGAIAAGGVAGFVALGLEAIKLGDEYTVLANKAQRFADAGHTVNDILQTEMSLSRDIHGSLEATSQIYSEVRQGTDDLNLSYKQQITLTKAISQEVQLSGRSLDEAGGLMTRLAFAFESGTMTGKEFKGMLREYPALNKTLQDSLHKSSAELLTMASTGRLTPRMILDALLDAAPKIEQRFSRMTETTGTKWQHFKDTLKIDFVEKTKQDFKDVQDGLSGLDDETKAATRNINALTEELKSQTGALFVFTQSFRDASKPIKTFTLDVDFAQSGVNALTRSLKMGLDEQHKIADARQQLEALNAAVKNGTIGGQDAKAMYESLMTTINGGELPASIKVWNEMSTPMRAYRQELNALISVWGNGAHSAQQYDEELSAIEKRQPGEHLEEALKRQTDAWLKLAIAARDAKLVGVTLPSDVGLTGRSFAAPERQAALDVKEAKKWDDKVNAGQNDMERRSLELLDANAGSVEKYTEAVLKLKEAKQDGIITGAQYSDWLSDLKDKYSTVKTAADTFRIGTKEVNEEFAAGIISLQQRTSELAKLKKTFEEEDPAHQKARATAKLIEEGLKPVEDELIKIAQTGKSSWREMIDDMLHNAERLAISNLFQGGINALATAFGSAVGGGSGDVVKVTNDGGAGYDYADSSARMAPGNSGPPVVNITVNNDPQGAIPALRSPSGVSTVAEISDKRAAVQARLRTRT